MFYKIAASIIRLMSVVLLVYQGFVYPFLKWQGRDFPEKIRNPIQGRKKNFKEWFDYVYAPVGTNLFGYAKILSDIFLIYQGNTVVGFLNVCYELTENLLKVGGHIGYSTHPDFQGQGLASLALAYGVQLLKDRGVDKVLVTCNNDNIDSARVIEKNGGVLENVLTTTGGAFRRYWIAV